MSDDVEISIQGAPLGYGRRLRVVRDPARDRPQPAAAVAADPEAPVRGAPLPPGPPRSPRTGTDDGRGNGRGGPGDGQPPSKPRLRKLRFFLILLGLSALAVISTVFGMLMAVASDIPQIENRQEYKAIGNNSYLYDDHWRPIGLFAAPNPEVIDRWSQISPAVVRAVLAVEDRRFWWDPGIDLKGIVRAFVSDVSGGPTQGASTITQQFVKNALQQQGNRTIFEKLREAALAFHLTQKWPRTKILTEYLNSVYFGNGAYGIESAARIYFGDKLGYDPNAATDGGTSSCGDANTGLPSCASKLRWWQAALLAGMISDPSAYDPIANRTDATARRNLVLRDMLEQHYIPWWKYVVGIHQPVPTLADLQQPSEPAAAPYFTSWLRPQILAAMGYRLGESPQRQQAAEYRAYYGGLKIRTTIDLRLQQAAEQSIAQILPYVKGGPVASMVAIDNRTGEVRAMVGGPIVTNAAGSLVEDYKDRPFNLASEAERQPGSAFKPFTLAVALESGFGPSSLMVSAPADFIVPHSAGKEHFIVHNFGNAYSGVISLQGATDVSDNSVFARLGIQGLGRNGTKRVRLMAIRAGIRSPVSSNYAMILGGLKIGVSPLDMAHAYETFADVGRRVNPILGSPDGGPTGIAEIRYDHHDLLQKPHYIRVIPAPVAQELDNMLTGPVQSGTATKAAISGVTVAGKTGTTSNYADAWFVGWTPQMTTAVWMGYPDRLVPMTTLYNGGPVEGGTFPAIIWHAFMVQALQILASEQPSQTGSSTTPTVTVPSAPATAVTSTSQAPASTTGNSKNNAAGGGTGNATGGKSGNGTGGSAGAPTGAGAGTGAGSGAATGAAPGSGSGSGAGSSSGGSGLGPSATGTSGGG